MSRPSLTAGLDGGSRMIKTVVWDAARQQMLGLAERATDLDVPHLAHLCLTEACAQAGVTPEALQAIVSTGYSRARLPGRALTEITCHARGVAHLLPQARAVIEIGGQDSKVIQLGPLGRVLDFAMNDRCAAGTGRFLELVAHRLGLQLDGLGQLIPHYAPIPISSMCVVFAESEIVGLLAAGADPGGVASGVASAVAERVTALAGRDLPGPLAFTGGVARIHGLPERLGQILGQPVLVPEHPQFTGALGAALLAAG